MVSAGLVPASARPLPSSLFNVSKQFWKASFPSFNTKDLFIARIRKDLSVLLEGGPQSIFAKWTEYISRVRAKGHNPHNDDDVMWMDAKALKGEANIKKIRRNSNAR